MKVTILIFLLCSVFTLGQNIQGVQVFNPNTQDETPVIELGKGQLILRFDDLDNTNQLYRYTIKHVDRNWQEDGLFFSEYADGAMNGILENYKSSFNTLQRYTHYSLSFPNEKIRPKISGNYLLIIYKDRPEKPLLVQRFVIVENMQNTAISVERYADAKFPNLKQRVQVRLGNQGGLNQNLATATISIMQDNNWATTIGNLKPSLVVGNDLLFQQLNIAFPGNNQFYYFDSKNMMVPVDRVARVSSENGVNETILFPVMAYPFDYQYQPDVHGAFYFRRNDNGIERDANKEADYTWVHFVLDSEPMEDKEIYVLGKFNEYLTNPAYKMQYVPELKQYIARIYLKQGFYNYILATKDKSGMVNMGEINGNFWQTTHLYQVISYYKSWTKNYDGAYSYGELRPVE